DSRANHKVKTHTVRKSTANTDLYNSKCFEWPFLPFVGTHRLSKSGSANQSRSVRQGARTRKPIIHFYMGAVKSPTCPSTSSSKSATTTAGCFHALIISFISFIKNIKH